MQHQVSNKDKPKSAKMQNRKLDKVCTGVYIVLTKNVDMIFILLPKILVSHIYCVLRVCRHLSRRRVQKPQQAS